MEKNISLKSLNNQEPAKVNQITSNKPNIKRTKNLLTGYIASTFNGGMNRCIAYKRVMAGEKIENYNITYRMRMLTPKVPAFQNLKITFRTYYVPDDAVWTNAEEYLARKGGSTVSKINERPNLDNMKMPSIKLTNSTEEEYDAYIPFTETTTFRDSWLSSYIPRIATGMRITVPKNSTEPNDNKSFGWTLPKVDALRLRGRIKIYNDFERNKQYDEELQEYKTDNVSYAEWQSYLPVELKPNTISQVGQIQLIGGSAFGEYEIKTQMRAKRQNSYYTDYRTEQLGEDETINELDLLNKSQIPFVEWQKRIAEYRSQAENAMKNDWDIIAEIRGSQVQTEKRVLLLSEITQPVNYTLIAQDTYNVNKNVEEAFQVMGQEGAYSYTDNNVDCINYFEPKMDGYIHVIATVSADTVFESGFDRLDLNVTWDSEYRPDMKNIKNDVIYKLEKTSTGDIISLASNSTDLRNSAFKQTEIDGYKRKYTELFKLPNLIQGDLTNNDMIEFRNKSDFEESYSNSRIIDVKDINKLISLNYYNFFETDDRNIQKPSPLKSQIAVEVRNYANTKNIWQDYTDLMINKNQAIQNEITYYNNNAGKPKFIKVNGNNQFDFVGYAKCLTDLPVDEDIKANVTKWGEE